MLLCASQSDVHIRLNPYQDRSGANFSARIAALSDNSSRMENSAVLRYCIIFFRIELLLNISRKRKTIGKGNINLNKNYL